MNYVNILIIPFSITNRYFTPLVGKNHVVNAKNIQAVKKGDQCVHDGRNDDDVISKCRVIQGKRPAGILFALVRQRRDHQKEGCRNLENETNHVNGSAAEAALKKIKPNTGQINQNC